MEQETKVSYNFLSFFCMKYTDYLKKLKGFSSKTIIIYNKYAMMLEHHDLDYKKLYMSLPDYSNNTLRIIVSAMKSYYEFLKDDRKHELTLPKKEEKVKDYITFKEYNDLLKNVNPNCKTRIQLRLIIRLLFETGIRSEELLSIKVDDIYLNQIKINGKGKRERIVKISNWLLSELESYVEGIKGRLFNFQYRNLYKRILKLPLNKKTTPHMFRRGYAKHCYAKGAPIYDISLSMGHSNLETTASYIKKKSEDVDIYKLF